MKIDTSRFGAIEVDESRVITMKGCILGFDHLQQYAVLLRDKNNPLAWLQSLEDGGVAFVVIDPFMIKRDYQPRICAADRNFLEISREEEMSFLAIVTIHSRPFRLTANLRAPLVINAQKRVGGQVVLEDDRYQVRHDISSDEADDAVGTAKITSF